MKGQIHHIGVIVEDLATARRFLEETLGMDVSSAGAVPALKLERAFMSLGEGAQVELIELADEAERAQRLGAGAQARVEHIAIEVDDVEVTRDELRRHGVEMQSATPSLSGPLRSYFTRPETSNGIAFQFLDRRGE